ncbi:NAD-dependent epimerase/dehydratase family protein, partial [Candidatus Kaiserbacteria bacterium]|nr:NAD-dependent epimerase/dehydratase family protein [Candidatus Kaiserbacteria bacterium]
MSERVLITGGGGYIGGVLVPLLLDAGYKVTVVDTFAHGVNTLASSCANPAFDAYRIDARDEAKLRPLAQNADWIIPLAALVGAPLCDRDPLGATSINLDAVK